ncbi:MAG: helix-turn-helix transcriptional regulator [Prosthecobacter sp.]|nr:helix-turn-helix transcriptional regulator [Prosthecobacter sp.]
MKNSDSVNWAQLRKDRGLTLQEAAAQSGYGAATINGLEKHGEGSPRLKTRLAILYGQNPDALLNPEKYSKPLHDYRDAMTVAETPTQRAAALENLRDKTSWMTEATELRERAEKAESKLSALKKALAELIKKD